MSSSEPTSEHSDFDPFVQLLANPAITSIPSGCQEGHRGRLLTRETYQAIGGVLGLLLGWSIAELVHVFVPAIPVHTPWHFALLAVLLAMVVGLLAGVVPARQAARMNPVDALRTE